MINRKELVTMHNPVLTQVEKASPLSVGNGELAYTADVTGMQTLYEEYDVVPLCTMSQWGWHTCPVSPERYEYTLQDLVMTEYECNGRKVVYPKKKFPGNEEVYDWLRQNPHRLNLARIGLVWDGKKIPASLLDPIRQELDLYAGMLESSFRVDGLACSVSTACDNRGKDVLAFRIRGEALKGGRLGVKIAFPYGSPGISASDWNAGERHKTECIGKTSGSMVLKRTLDRDVYYVEVAAEGAGMELSGHELELSAAAGELSFTVSFAKTEETLGRESVEECFENSRSGWQEFWEKGGILRLNQSKDSRAVELERRVILSQYLMALNSAGSAPPQETGLTCNSWYGKMHLEMYLWHCAWLPLWNHTDLLERSLDWYLAHLPQARENAARNGYRGARWPKMIASEGIDCPSPIAPLLVWQQPHVIYMLEMAYQSLFGQEAENGRGKAGVVSPGERAFLEKYWPLVEESAVFMADFVVKNPDTGRYDICAPVIPVQECHSERTTHNPAFEVAYFSYTLSLAAKWACRLEKEPEEKWLEVAGNMAPLTEQEGVYLATENCKTTFTEFNRDHPSMLGAYGLIDGSRIPCAGVDPSVMSATLDKVLECWDYPTLWGWDFAMMAMTAVRAGRPELAIEILLKDTPKNCYLANGQNMQIGRPDLPLYLPGNGSLLLAVPIMVAGYEGCNRKTPGFPDDGQWTVEYEGIHAFL